MERYHITFVFCIIRVSSYKMVDTLSSSDDEDVIGFMYKPDLDLSKPNYFLEWDENEFYNIFRLSKPCENIILDLIIIKIELPTNRYI